MDLESAQFNFNGTKEIEPPQYVQVDRDSLAYKEQLAKVCGIALNNRILSFAHDAPQPVVEDLRSGFKRPLHKPNNSRRLINTMPTRVLDASGIKDDYYLNILSWSERNILAIALDTAVYMWNPSTGNVSDLCHVDPSVDDYVASLEWSPDAATLAVGMASGDTQLWDVESGSKLRSMMGRTTRVGVLSWGNKMLSSGAQDGSIWNHDVRSANHKAGVLAEHVGEVCGLEWRYDGGMLASGGNDNKVIIWDARTTTSRFSNSHMAAVKAIAWCPWQLNLLASGGGTQDRKIQFWNTTTSANTGTIDTGSQVTSLVWSRQYKELLSSHGYPNNVLSLWHYTRLSKICDLSGHDRRILCTALSPDGQTVASCAADANLKLWLAFEKKAKAGGASAVGAGRGAAKKDSVDDDLVSGMRRMAVR
ncbi:quinon protein alcohol dehydrogenase-like superfamily [Cladochytrium replicatum]|nr:quinon protein alcohol dehydrogenase-like superfamily [Cladochytrium replicatum]